MELSAKRYLRFFSAFPSEPLLSPWLPPNFQQNGCFAESLASLKAEWLQFKASGDNLRPDYDDVILLDLKRPFAYEVSFHGFRNNYQ
jgi:hypothetical protein